MYGIDFDGYRFWKIGCVARERSPASPFGHADSLARAITQGRRGCLRDRNHAMISWPNATIDCLNATILTLCGSVSG